MTPFLTLTLRLVIVTLAQDDVHGPHDNEVQTQKIGIITPIAFNSPGLKTHIWYRNFFLDLWTLSSAELNFIFGGAKIARQKVRHAPRPKLPSKSGWATHCDRLAAHVACSILIFCYINRVTPMAEHPFFFWSGQSVSQTFYQLPQRASRHDVWFLSCRRRRWGATC